MEPLTVLTRAALSPEAQLLMAAADAQSVDQAALLRLLAGDIDWSKVTTLAHQEGATTMLWQRVGRTANGQLPRTVATQWQKLAMIGEFELRRLELILHEVLELVATRDIEAMLLKGSALAHTIYGSFPDRPMSDLDLLIRPERAQEAWSLLQSEGWTWPAASWPVERYTAHQHLPPLVQTRGAEVRLELHTALLPDGHPFDWPVDNIWRGVQRLAKRGRSVLVPHPLHQLLHVCTHFAWSHEMRWGSWRALRDVAAITQRTDVDWVPFVHLARDSRAMTCCYWSLRLARTLAGARVPENVLEALRPPRPAFVLDRLEFHYLGQLFSSERGCPSETLNRGLWELGIAPRWSRHGKSRPWHGSSRWMTAPTRRSARLLQRARHAAEALGYVSRLSFSHHSIRSLTVFS